MVLVLRDVEGFSAEEVAEILGISVAAVKSRLHRARLFLRERLGEHAPRPGAGEPFCRARNLMRRGS
jgi:RNA polymerase sigma-70 factor (ECF subfamily)